MRVSTSQVYNIANIGMRDAQVAIDKTNEQLSSGKRVLSPADDPIAATSILSLNQEIARTAQYKKNIDAADNSLNLEETTLNSVSALVQRIRELAVSAGNTAVLTAADYKAIAAEVDSRIDEAKNLLNTRNASGQYIFAGYQSETVPFADKGGGNFVYQGDDGQLRLQASSSVTVPVSDSGKRLFMDIPASHNTFSTSANPANLSSPPAIIGVGDVYDQALYDQHFPEDMVVTFNATAAVVPPSPNYTVTERTTGKILVANQVYVSGQDIQVNGAKFAVFGSPYPGTAPTAATLPLGTFAATDFTGAGATSIDITVGGITENFTLDQNITSLADLVTALGGDASYPNANPISNSASAAANYAKLQNLGLTLDTTGFTMPKGLNITVKNGAASTDTLTGLTTQGSGTTTANGVVATPGDTFFIEATNKQSLLTTLSRFSDAMKNMVSTEKGRADLASVVAKTLTNLESTVTNVASVLGEVGARQNMLQSSQDLNTDSEMYSKSVLAQLQDLDYAEASTRLQMQTFVLSAAQQSFVKVSQLSLFTYL